MFAGQWSGTLPIDYHAGVFAHVQLPLHVYERKCLQVVSIVFWDSLISSLRCKVRGMRSIASRTACGRQEASEKSHMFRWRTSPSSRTVCNSSGQSLDRRWLWNGQSVNSMSLFFVCQASYGVWVDVVSPSGQAAMFWEPSRLFACVVPIHCRRLAG